MSLFNKTLNAEGNVVAITHQQIVGQRFEKRRRGYDREAVHRFLDRVAQHVAGLQDQLAAQATDHAALAVLKNAERAAHDTRIGAEIDANRDRAAAAEELEQARQEAARLLQEGQAEAERIVSRATSEAAAIHHAAEVQTADRRGEAHNVAQFIAQSVADLRLGANRLQDMADHFECELSNRSVESPSDVPSLGPSAASNGQSPSGRSFWPETGSR